MLSSIQHQEAIAAGVAGAFLHGANWGFESDWASFSAGFDMKPWFIETLRNSAQEPDIPHIQALEFYAHELFAYDGYAIREFLNMGRSRLAVMTATEAVDAIPRLLPVLEEMAASNDLAVAAAIREYLADPFHHAGLQRMHKQEDESA